MKSFVRVSRVQLSPADKRVGKKVLLSGSIAAATLLVSKPVAAVIAGYAVCHGVNHLVDKAIDFQESRKRQYDGFVIKQPIAITIK